LSSGASVYKDLTFNQQNQYKKNRRKPVFKK